MADWTLGMARSYEFWEVDPATWGDSRLIEGVTEATLTRDSDDEALGSASFSMDSWEGERYVRVYLVVRQFGVREKVALGTYLVQAPDRDFDGMRGSTTATGYTPLKELADDYPPEGYYVNGGTVEGNAARLARTYGRAPVDPAPADTATQEAYVAQDDETWLAYCKGLLAAGKKHFAVSPRGVISVAPDQDPWSLMPMWTFDDSNSSILQADVQVTSNMPETPNVVRVVYSKDSGCLYAEASNSDPESENSTAAIGRRKTVRESSPDLPDNPSQADVNAAARKLLREKGAAAYEVTFTHAFVPDIDLGTAVRLNYSAMGLDVVAVVKSQVIQCTPACQVQTTATYVKEKLA